MAAPDNHNEAVKDWEIFWDNLFDAKRLCLLIFMIILLVVRVKIAIKVGNAKRTLGLVITLLSMLPGIFTALSYFRVNGEHFSLGALLLGGNSSLIQNGTEVYVADMNWKSNSLDLAVLFISIAGFAYALYARGVLYAVVSSCLTAASGYLMARATDVSDIYHLKKADDQSYNWIILFIMLAAQGVLEFYEKEESPEKVIPHTRGSNTIGHKIQQYQKIQQQKKYRNTGRYSPLRA